MPHIDLDNPGEGHKQVQGVNQIEEKNNRGTWRVATEEEVGKAGPLIYPKPFDPTSFLERLILGDGTEGPPTGWSTTQKQAVIDAKEAYNFEGDPAPGEQYPFDIIRSGLYFTYVDKKVEAPSEKRYSVMVSPINGNTYAVDMANPTKELTEDDIIFKAANTAPEGAVPIGEKPIDLGNGRKMQPYAITDASGVTTRYNVILEEDTAAPTEKDIITFDAAAGGGRLIPLGDGRYTYEASRDAPFTTSPKDVVPLPNQNGSLIKISPTQYQFVRDTYEPGVVQDPVTGRYFNQRPDGIWTELDPRYNPEVADVDGMKLLQQRSGVIGQLTPATLDQIITQALVDGEYDKAFAFQDFRDRPTAQEAFNTALAFARSPADQRIISSIARGITPVQPPPEGTIQRVGPQPDFLVQAYQDFQRRTQAGRAPTEEEATTLSARAAAGQTPLTDTLQSRLEELKIENQQLKNDAIALKTQQDQQVFQQNNPSLFGGEDPGLTQFKLDLGLSSGSSMPESTKQTLQDLIANLPDDKKQYAITQAESIHRGELSAEQVIGNLRMFADPTPSTTSTPDTSGEPTPEDNWASSIAAYPDLTRATFDLLGGQNLENMAAWEINVHAGNAGTGGVLDPANRGDRTFDPDRGEWVNPNTGSGANENDSSLGSTNPNLGETNAGENNPLSFNSDTGSSAGENILLSSVPSIVSETAPTVTGTLLADDVAQGRMGQMEAETIASSLGLTLPNMRSRAGGGTVQPGEITVVGEQGPEIAMMPPGTHILPLGPATKRDIKAAQASGRAYQTGGIVFGDLAPGLQQLQRGRPITPPRGYLFQQGGLTLPSMQALQNLTPTVRESFYGMHGDIGISPADFRQELQTAAPRGTRLPTSRMLPLGRRGVR